MSKQEKNPHAQFVDLIEQALTRPPADRLAWLRRNAPVDEITDVQRLMALASSDTTPTLPVAGIGGEMVGRKFGVYELVESVGSGTMGQVYRARRYDGTFEQTVAVKLLTCRFTSETRMLARLDHPNIARLLDGGTTPEGVHYVVMEFVEGVALDEFLAQNIHDARAIVTLMIKLCRAVQSAHEALIIHRDIKPQNILVTPAGEPKLLDFGIARQQGHDDAGATLVGAMTMAYASPEQLRGAQLTTSADVYSLGLVLYEALCGQLPFDIDALSPAQLVRHLELHTIVPPSARGTNTRRRNWRDLDAIVLKALAPESVDRYGAAGALADDLERYLKHRPVDARAPSAGYRLRKLAARHRVSVAVLAAAGIALVGGLGMSLWQTGSARYETDIARAQLERAEVVSSYMASVLAGRGALWTQPPRRGNAAATIGDVLDSAQSKLAQALGDYPAVRIELMTRLSEAQLWLDDVERAAALMYEAIEIADRELPEDSPLRVDVRYHLGSAYLDNGAPEQAIEVFDDALAVSRSQGSLGNLRWIYIATEKALAYGEMGLFQSALDLHLDATKRWFELYGDEPMAAWSEGFYAQSYFKFALGDIAGADESLGRAKQAVALFPDQTRSSRVAIFALAGRIAIANGDHAAAIRDFEQAVEYGIVEYDQYGEGYPLLRAASYLALVSCERGELDVGRDTLDQALSALPEHTKFGDGWIYHEARAVCANARGDFEAALAYAQESERLGLMWPYTLVHSVRREQTKAMIYANLGRLKDAARAREASRELRSVWLGSN